MQPAIILGGKAAASGDLLRLLLSVPEECDLCADCAAIAGGAFELKFDPLVGGRYRVLVEQERALLIGYDNIEHAAIPEIGESDGASIVSVGDANGLGYVDELSGSIIQPDSLILIARKTAPLERWPVFGVADDRAIASGDFGEVVPVAAIAVE